MKNSIFKSLIGLAFLCMLAGCSPEFWDVVDALTEDPVVHSGTVKQVELSEDQTTVHFLDGVSYTVKGTKFVVPGREAKIIRTDAGFELSR